MEAAGDVGFETLVRALARNDQETLARQLDEKLADDFVKKPSELASTSSASSLMPAAFVIIIFLFAALFSYKIM